MKIVQDYPPNYSQIKEKFQLTGREMFTYGDTVYFPGGTTLPPELVAHEQIHINQQGSNPEAWWERYLVDEQFRLDQEIEAHRAEYRAYCSLVKDRNKQSVFLNQIALRLASPIYGGIITSKDAIRKIKNS